jgi:hypothetical protein
MFNTACYSTSITSVVLKLWPFSFTFSWGNKKVEKEDGWGMTVLVRFPAEKEM